MLQGSSYSLGLELDLGPQLCQVAGHVEWGYMETSRVYPIVHLPNDACHLQAGSGSAVQNQCLAATGSPTHGLQVCASQSVNTPLPTRWQPEQTRLQPVNGGSAAGHGPW